MDDNIKNQQNSEKNDENEVHKESEASEVNEVNDVLNENLNSQSLIDTTIDDEFSKLKESYMRLLAEIVNIKKNVDLDKQKAKLGLILKVISIVDTYSVISSASNTSGTSTAPEVEDIRVDSEYKLNFESMLQQLEILIATEGVSRVDMNIGDEYNSETAEVISAIEGDSENKIISIVSPAYEMNGKLIKTAKIVVSKKKS